MKIKSWKNSAYALATCGLLSLLLNTIQNHLEVVLSALETSPQMMTWILGLFQIGPYNLNYFIFLVYVLSKGSSPHLFTIHPASAEFG